VCSVHVHKIFISLEAQQDNNDRIKKENGEIFRQLNEGSVAPRSTHCKILTFDSQLRGKVKVIIIIGPAGSGKSNLVKLITNKDIKVGHELKSGMSYN
jgi:polynucleotide 5'-kinase involved in rRNA processing